MRSRRVKLAAVGGLLGIVGAVGCGGGGTTMTPPGIPAVTAPAPSAAPAVPAPTAAPITPPAATPTPASPSAQQVIRMGLPSGAIGSTTDPTFGAIGGYTLGQTAQVLTFAPGAKVMIQNAESAPIPHTLGVVGTTGFPSGQPAALSASAAGGSTLGASYQSGTVNAGAMVGPVTLQQGTYYIGCFYHYAIGMRDVILVGTNAAAAPSAAPTAAPTPVPGPIY